MEKSEAIIAVLLVIAIVASIASMVIMNQKVSSVTGKATGTVQANINEMISFVLSPDTVNFGGVDQLSTHTSGTGGLEPASFGISNNGTVKINITASSTALFSGSTKVASDYQFKATSSSAESVASFTDFSGTGQPLLGMLNFSSGNSATADIKIHVPSDEPAGAKSATVTFVASKG